MEIKAKVKHRGEYFGCDDAEAWKTLSSNCPSLEKVFREESCYGGPGFYKIKHDDKRLRTLMSEIDKFRRTPEGRYHQVYFLNKNIREVLIKSMSRKKDMDVYYFIW